LVIKEKRKRKETIKKKLEQAIKSQPRQRQYNLEESLGPLRQGQRLDATETKTSSSKEQ
jgi:hypothetical protein